MLQYKYHYFCGLLYLTLRQSRIRLYIDDFALRRPYSKSVKGPHATVVYPITTYTYRRPYMSAVLVYTAHIDSEFCFSYWF